MTKLDGTSMNLQQDAIAFQGAKIGGLWLAIGITSWTDAAAFLAFLLSLAACCEYMWKKAIRPLMVRYGYAKPRKRRSYERKEGFDDE